MNGHFAAPGRSGAYGGSVAEVFVLCAMAFATLAVATALTQQLGLDFWVATMSALALYFVLLAMHAVVRRRAAAGVAGRAGLQSNRQGARPLGSAEPVRPEAPPLLPGSAMSRRPIATTAGQGHPADAGQPRPGAVPHVPVSLARDVRAVTSGPNAAAAPAAATPFVSPREADVEMLQALIRKLADEVNAAEANVQRGATVPPSPERAIGRSIDALRIAAGTMRSGDDNGSAKAKPLPPAPLECAGDQPMSAGAAASPDLATRISEALSDGRVDLFLQPILELGSHRPRHFEVSLRLRDADGEPIALASTADDASATSLLPRVEAAGIARTAQLAIRLEARGRQDQLFSPISGRAIADGPFLVEVADAYRQRETFAGQLVMTFVQADVRGFGERQWSTLADLADLGFRFGIGAVTDLDMDFEDLKGRGFDFVKLDAEVFLEGLPLGQAVIPASDLTRHLASIGLATIVGHIDDEAVAARVLGFGVLFGQGLLFGAPRPVKPEPVESHGTVAA
ncbi:MAG: EAL domain-containing protein [Hyphomicrobiaceae bacterium]|nr:EAL domain-containing protein [Hyphomicrobiaceae bacterium]